MRRLASTATVTGQGASLVDPSVRGGDFSWPKAGTSHGHQRGHQLAITGDFFMATDTWHAEIVHEATAKGELGVGSGHQPAPAVGLLGRAHRGRGPAHGVLEEAEGVLDIKRRK